MAQYETTISEKSLLINVDDDQSTTNDLHDKKHLKVAVDIIRDIIIGLPDGLTVPFALSLGLSGANASSSTVLTAGVAQVTAGTIFKGLNGYLAAKAENEHYKAELKREKEVIKNQPDAAKLQNAEAAEVENMLAKYGLARHDYSPLINGLRKKPHAWLHFMMKFELGLEKPDPQRALKTAITITIASIVGGLVPLIPYMLIPAAKKAGVVSVILTSVALLIFGYAKGYLTGNAPLKTAFQTAVIGVVATVAAFGLAKVVPA